MLKSVLSLSHFHPMLTLRIRCFAHNHDDIPAFHAAYLVTTFLAAALFHAGFFAILIALHMCLDYVKYRDFHHCGILLTFKAMILESIGDIALLLLSVTFAVYLHHTFFLVAVSGLLRSELSIVRMLGIVLPRVQIIEHLLTILHSSHAYFIEPLPNISRPLTRMQMISMLSAFFCVFLLALSFTLYSGHTQDLLQIIRTEFGIVG